MLGRNAQPENHDNKHLSLGLNWGEGSSNHIWTSHQKGKPILPFVCCLKNLYMSMQKKSLQYYSVLLKRRERIVGNKIFSSKVNFVAKIAANR